MSFSDKPAEMGRAIREIQKKHRIPTPTVGIIRALRSQEFASPEISFCDDRREALAFASAS